MTFLEKLMKAGYPQKEAEDICKQYMEIQNRNGRLDNEEIDRNKVDFD